MYKLLFSYLSMLIRLMQWKVALVLCLMVCQSLTEGIGLLMLVPLLSLVGVDVGPGSLGKLGRSLSSMFTAVGFSPTLVTVLGVFVLITIVHSLISRWQRSVGSTLQHEVVASLRNQLYSTIANASWLFLSKNRSSDFIHVLTIETERVGDATLSLLRLFSTALVALVYIVFALRLSVVMTALVFTCGAGLMLVLHRKTKMAWEAGQGLSEAMNKLYAAMTQHFQGMKTAKSYGAENRYAKGFLQLTDRIRRMYMMTEYTQADVKYWFDLGSVLCLSLILYISFKVLNLPTAEVVLLLLLFARLMPMFVSLQQSYQSFINYFPGFCSVIDLQTRCELTAEPKAGNTENAELQKDIHFDCVSFRYDTAPVFCDLHLTVRAGETTAIVGPSGVGKSTIADLILGLLVPSNGQVLVDGKPLSPERLRSWRSQIGYVPQETFLFHDSIRANLLWVCPDATEENIWKALRLAAADDFVSNLPHGLETVVGDAGIRLSGGERQRLALARALLRQPVLLILDEATSALDSENEQRIQSAIEALHGSMTILVISHRLSTVRGADMIYVLEEGRVVESGTWASLFVQGNGRFRELCLAQNIESEG